ncbi:nitroreductase family protein [Acidovorax sp.]|uniref:nitroreductase family protein n=1 Tax=Acidovorax sp. TaxID=1872122 RepID=UPI002ACEE0FD|nr:nitroreductase family protein [Acidovorax sp.]MDZ7865971.1 nitroreductase family protein [Acidovorax sp.]
MALLARRKNTSPRRLSGPGPDAHTLSAVMEAAVTAPDHGLLVPWHFILIPKDMRQALGRAFAAALIERDPGATEAQTTAAAEKADRAPCLLVAVMHADDGTSGIPDQERLVSLGCAIQNILLAATSMGYASGLTSGRSLGSNAVRSLLGLHPHHRAICFIALGTSSAPPRERQRPDPHSVLRVLSA